MLCQGFFFCDASVNTLNLIFQVCSYLIKSYDWFTEPDISLFAVISVEPQAQR